jgi:hypothetical protein
MNPIIKYYSDESELPEHACISLEDIKELGQFGNSLLSCKSLEEISKILFDLISDKIHPQVSSMLIFLKDGYIERVSIRGIDKNKAPISDDWLCENNIRERYLRGESFAGSVIVPDNTDYAYGNPAICNDFKNGFKGKQLKFYLEYEEKLGFVQCGISVPLNGTNHTFGSIKIINKINIETAEPDPSKLFTPEDLGWLTIVGGHVSAAISRLRKSKEDELIGYLTDEIAQYDLSNQVSKNDNVLEEVARKIAEGELMPYKVCLIRMLEHDGHLPIYARAATSDISFKDKGNSSRHINSGLVGNACKNKNKKPIEIENIDARINEFASKDWIRASNLKSFFCFSFVIQGNCVGTISIFTGDKHTLYESDRRFLTTLSCLLAMYRIGLQKSKEGNNTMRDTDTLYQTRQDKRTSFRPRQLSHTELLPKSIAGIQPKDQVKEFVFSELFDQNKEKIDHRLIHELGNIEESIHTDSQSFVLDDYFLSIIIHVNNCDWEPSIFNYNELYRVGNFIGLRANLTAIKELIGDKSVIYIEFSDSGGG